MKTKEVPQDGIPIAEGQRRAVYAMDDAGHYEVVPSTGWEAEELAGSHEVEWFANQAAAARARARARLTSPLEYHMYRVRMDLATLAQTTGLWQWRVRRHFRPDAFAALSDRMLARYARAIGCTVAQLSTVEDG